MIERVVESALRHRTITVGLAVSVILAGCFAWSTLQKEAYPDVGDTQVTVITEFPGRAAEEVEKLVTLPLGRALNGVPRVIARRSKTLFGLTVASLTFEDDVPDYWARQRVFEKINEADLPEGVEPRLAPLTGPVGEILRYVVEGQDEHTPMDLRTIQDWMVAPRLLQAPGVADVITFGGFVKQYHIITSPEKLSKYGLSIVDVIHAIQANNFSTGGNIIQQGGQGFVVRGIGALRGPKDIEKVVITSAKGVPVFVENIATVEPFPKPPSGILSYSVREPNGEITAEGSGVQGLVAMRRGENASEVVRSLKQKVEDIQRDLPEGVRLRLTYDRGDLVHYTIRTVSHTLFEGISIVVLILIFFFGSVRSALVVATTIPLSLLFAFVMMKITQIPANLLSLGAIDFGIIVDGAVVMVESILRRYRESTANQRQQGILILTLSAASEVSREIFFSIVIIISAYLPIFSFQRVEGKLFSPMAYTLAFAVLGSMLLALTLIPVLMSRLYSRWLQTPGAAEWPNPVYDWLENKYRQWVFAWTEHPAKTIRSASVSVGASLLVGWCSVGTEFLPQLDEGAVNIRAFFPVGISLQEAEKYVLPIRECILRHPQVKLVIAQLGRNEDGTDPYGPNRLEILVELEDYKKWPWGSSKHGLLSAIRKDLHREIPGVRFSFSQPILDNVTEAVTGSVADLAILISGDNLDLMRQKAGEILKIVQQIPGARDTGIEQEGDQAELVVDVNREAIARFGINIAEVQRMIEAAIGGKPISTLHEGGKRFDIVVRYLPQFRASIEAVKDMRVNSPTGAQIPLNHLATIRLTDGPTLIQRQDGMRQVSVRTNVVGRDQGSFVKQAQRLIAKKVQLPKGYRLHWGGQFENLSRAAGRLAVVIPLTLVIIFLILYVLYRNVWDVSIAFSCIPFSLVGGLLALAVRGYCFNVSSGVGFISLFGIATMSGVLFVSRVRRLRAVGEGMDQQPLVSIVRQAAVLQFRTRVTTVLLALFGLIPAALAHGIGSDVQRPLATVVVGGLASGLLLSLSALPALYLAVEPLRQRWRKQA